jgi:hypothetical protein
MREAVLENKELERFHCSGHTTLESLTRVVAHRP